MKPNLRDLRTEASDLIEAGDLAGAIELLSRTLREMDIAMYSIAANETLLENTKPLADFANAFRQSVTPVREIAVLILEINEYDINPNNWLCWPVTARKFINPNDSPEALERFCKYYQGPEGYWPFELKGCPQMNAAIAGNLELISDERIYGRENDAHQIALDLMPYRFYELTQAVSEVLLSEFSFPESMKVMATVEASDYFYICHD
jgi:hypothetical protein